MTAKQYLHDNFDTLVDIIKKCVSYDTVKGTSSIGAPFGNNVKECLNYVLFLASKMGFEVYDCDGYAGHADFKGTGKETLGILGHLDVVPVKSEEWKFPPFGGETDDGKLYGRGTMDDKGPVLACLFAAFALKQTGFVPNKTVRIIFGCDEESGMDCVKYYFSKVKAPNISFSPDADFPVINREKGIYQFSVNCGKLPEGVFVTAGERANVVPSFCRAVINGCVQFKDEKVSVEHKDNVTVLTAFGKSAHGSTPSEGDNAAWKIFAALAKAFPDNAAIGFVNGKLSDYTGKSWGIDMCDEPSGSLTCNLGVVRTVNGELIVTVDIRFPVTFPSSEITKRLEKNTPFSIMPEHISEPLYVPSNNFLVKTLTAVYNDETGENLEPVSIGGGTYSRCLSNCVAFGPLFPDEIQTIHMPNENISLDNLKKMTEIYIEAIRRLSE